MEKEFMFKLKPEFQKEIFEKVINKYKSSIKASKYLKVPASSIRCYKNLYFNSVPNNILQRIVNLGIITKEDLKKNVLEILDKKDIIKKSLDSGREKRKEYFANLKASIPSLNKIIVNNQLNIFEWFESYQNLVNSNLRKMQSRRIF